MQLSAVSHSRIGMHRVLQRIRLQPQHAVLRNTPVHAITPAHATACTHTTTPDTSGCFSMSTWRLPRRSRCSISWKFVFSVCLYLHWQNQLQPLMREAHSTPGEGTKAMPTLCEAALLKLSPRKLPDGLLLSTSAAGCTQD